MAEGKDLFQVEIITPDRVFFAGEADMLEFNTADGEIGVYKNHIPHPALISPGTGIILPQIPFS